jgi:NAD(P)H-hydrate epimerase
MATGGSGDVLAGVIASFAAQGASPTDAARLGVLAHALAGDAAAAAYGNRGMIASDIIEKLCEVLD